MPRVVPLSVLAAALLIAPASASQTSACRKACAGWRPECVKACEAGGTSAYKQREKRNTHCKAANTTWAGARECIARARRIDMHGR